MNILDQDQCLIAKIWNVKALDFDSPKNTCIIDTPTIICRLRYVAEHADILEAVNLNFDSKCETTLSRC